ncbi:D-alanyl-D-alanine carboxypeptidase family protein [Streptomyces sp. NPDC051684]|uniref:D-alanyl-D-alanine carboxypeptidase family protein n=1 Tax=Streptomyces sp. NPDC051684 TaxID=3365670 RepID=UPI00379E83AB
MAGTPDKSGEHKASGGPAPEDPRLAVSRGVDQETAVFSVHDSTSGEDPGRGDSVPDPDARPAPEDAGDERLRAAVAAWVAGDDAPAETSALANPDGGEESEAEAAPATDDADKAAAKDADGADAKSAAKADGKPDAEGAGTADAQSSGKTGATAASAAAATGDTKSPSAADGAKGADKVAAKADGNSGAEGAGKADATADAAKPEAKDDAKGEPEADAKSGAKADAAADGPSDAKAGASAAAGEPEAKDGGDAGRAAAKSGAGDAGKAGATAAAAKADAEGAGKADATGDAKSDVKADAQSASAADGATDAKSAADAGKAADGKSGAEGAGKADAESAEKVDATDGAEADARSGAKADAKGAGKAAPAAGDAKSDAEGAGKGDAKSGDGVGREVDQATAVFKAVPQPVDQPTTTLKAAGTAQSSKFVPLKSLDEGKATGKELPPEAEQPTVEPAERTTQQPLPPKPPLDLLAELTNTPPPPETRVRTAVRRVKVWTPIVILLIVVFGVVQAVRPLPTPTLSLTSDSTYSFDGDKASLPWPGEGQGWMDVQGIGTMDNFGKQTPVPIGSVAKSMTAYIVLKDHPLKAGADGPSITVDATAEKEGGYDADGQNESTLNTVKEGDKISQKDALAAVMIPSANNIARLLARWDAGSEEAFVKKMNATAKKLGMKNTTYTDPSGLKESTVSTAEDQVKLGNELVQIPALTDITKLPTWTDPSGKKWTNYNRLVPYDGAIGIKTGTTTKAGGNLLFAATKDAGGSTVTVVGAVLGQHKAPIIDTVNAVSKTAMLAAQDAVTSATVLKKGDVVGYVDDQLGGHTPVTVTKDVKAVGWAGKTVHLQLADQDGKSVPHTGKAGETVGVLEVGDGEGGAVEVPVALQKGLTEPGFGAKLTRVG